MFVILELFDLFCDLLEMMGWTIHVARGRLNAPDWIDIDDPNRP